MRPTDIRYIVVHCSATRASQSYSPEALEHDHRARGFRSAGYHFYIRRSGAIIPLRPLEQIGAHARGYNRLSYGVCYEGGLDDAGHQQIPAPPSSVRPSVSSLSTSTHSPHKLPSSATVTSAPTATVTAVSPLTNGSSYAPASMPRGNITTSPSAP